MESPRLPLCAYFRIVCDLKKKFRKIQNTPCIFRQSVLYYQSTDAGVMELVDVVDSKSTAGDSVPVRVRPPAPIKARPQTGPRFYSCCRERTRTFEMQSSGGALLAAGLDGGNTLVAVHSRTAMQIEFGERWERCQWQKKRPERVAAVDS